ncbi:Metalloenzyme, LuxS/M16 peptidase-like protein [Phlebopus sp. FC_14]|nr:Metalloenzyme, LuxS/M16 peptidase-like protein [Phlebopus sp. FC_14]
MTVSDWKLIPQNGHVPPYSVFTRPLEKSQVDEREYRVIRLQNGLNAMLVHDPKTENAAASLDVAVGHLSDPDDMPGLAHFCEHLLFMGTEQFPKENEYSEYLSKNNGSSNAYTSSSNTNYHFHVSPTGLLGALERFSGFFHSPLFAPSCTARELNAVDSEHKKNHQADPWRIFQLNKTLTKDGHPWSKFGTGNRSTLSAAGREAKAKGKLRAKNVTNGDAGTTSVDGSLAPSPISSRVPSPTPSSTSTNSEAEADGGAIGRETRRRLVEWWSKEYCASRMKVCVVGRETLDELSGMVSRLFSSVQNRGQDSLPMINDHPFGPNEMGTLVSVQTIMSFHAVEISFPLAWQPQFWKYKPGYFLSHLVGHEGPGSLHSYLREKGWITSLSAAPQALGRGFAMFKATMYLTKEGFDNYRSVVLATFKFLNLLRSTQFAAWFQSEIAAISKIQFQFAEKRAAEGYAVSIAERISWPVPTEKLLSASVLISDWDGDEGQRQIQDALANIRVDTSRVVLMAKKEEHERITGGAKDWQSEKWYGTGYTVEKWSEEFLADAQKPNDIREILLPSRNEFIPTNLDVERRNIIGPQKRPHLVYQSDISTVWYKKDDQFWLPKASVVMEIRSPLVAHNPRAAVLTRLFSDLVNDSLTEYTYDADLAGLGYNFGAYSLGVAISLKGYNDKLPELAKRIVEAVKNLQVRQDRLDVMKEKLKRQWENFFMSQTYQLSDYYGRYALTHNSWTIEEQLQELPGITKEDVQNHVVQLLQRVNVQTLVIGNMYKDQAITLAQHIETILDSGPLSPMPVDRALILPEGSNYLWTAPVPNPNEANSSLTYYVHLGPLTDRKRRVTGILLAQILSEPAFNVLRTKEQLGYIVACSRWNLPGDSQFGLRIIVQSERLPTYLEKRVEVFLEGMEIKLEGMEIDEFNEFKRGLQQRWREPAKNLGEEASRFWAHIDSGYFDFLRLYEDADLIENVTKEEVLRMFGECVHPKAPRRSKLSIHLQSRKPRPLRISAAAIEEFENLVKEKTDTDPAELKEFSREESPLATDYINHWQGVLTEGVVSADVARDLVKKIPALVERYPVPDEDAVILSAGVTKITDLSAFKASLHPSDIPRPLVDWNDLPTAKF